MTSRMAYNEVVAVAWEQFFDPLRAILELNDLDISGLAFDEQMVCFFKRADPVVAVLRRQSLAPVHANWQNEKGQDRKQRHHPISPKGAKLEHFDFDNDCRLFLFVEILKLDGVIFVEVHFFGHQRLLQLNRS